MKTVNLLTILVSVTLIIAGLMTQPSNATGVNPACTGAPYNSCTPGDTCSLLGDATHGEKHCADCDGDGVFHELQRWDYTYQCVGGGRIYSCFESKIIYGAICTPTPVVSGD